MKKIMQKQLNILEHLLHEEELDDYKIQHIIDRSSGRYNIIRLGFRGIGIGTEFLQIWLDSGFYAIGNTASTYISNTSSIDAQLKRKKDLQEYKDVIKNIFTNIDDIHSYKNNTEEMHQKIKRIIKDIKEKYYL